MDLLTIRCSFEIMSKYIGKGNQAIERYNQEMQAGLLSEKTSLEEMKTQIMQQRTMSEADE